MATNGMTDREQEAWGQVVDSLRERGVSPAQVKKEMYKRLKKTSAEDEDEEADEGLVAWASHKLSAPVTWKGVLYALLGLIAFAGLLWLIGEAFDLHIPLIHSKPSLTE